MHTPLPAPPDWAPFLDDHRAAVAEFCSRAAAVDAARWGVPRASGKWSPAQEVMHLVLFYRVSAVELRGGGAPQLRGTPWRRLLWRWTVLPYILRRGAIPVGARAPREVRPPERPGDRSSLLADLRAATEAWERALLEARAARPERGVTHPFFGRLPLRVGLRFAALHTRNHASHLPSI